MNQEFVNALNETRLIKLTFDSQSKGVITRTCVPMDYGPSRRYSSSEPRYHFIDLYSSSGAHPLSITPEQVIAMEILKEKFRPEKIIHWRPQWHIARDWGVFS